ncbi:HAMP domain-containing protein [Thiogranum longum]|uniref:histidine kinase n=1 Tax=Thiogranum longum TaxID=1537524 RepID=A0A4R1HDJ8_9GAMM|nr:ATP-binding protein [Thiogranum longum]TCK18781.1 HAMP domain-containing protein [Thiogranum longum]
MRWGLYTRLAISLGVLLAVAMLTLGYMLLSDATKRLENERLMVTRTLARTLAEGSVDALAADDYELMERWVSSVLPDNNYAYAFLSRPDGLILTHTQLDRIGHRIDTDKRIETGPDSFQTMFKDQPVQEVVYPVNIGNKHLADAHIAYYVNRSDLLDSETTTRILGIVALFLLLLLGAALLIIRRHTRPLSELATSITNVSLDAAHTTQLDRKLLQRTDEIGALAREYSDMLDRLGAAYTELQNEEQRLRERVEERTSELRQSNLELESFSYSVSHDLRAPLRAMAGYSQILLEDHASSIDAEGRHALQRIRDSTFHMDQLISDLLALSRVSRHTMQHKPVDLSAMATEIVAGLRQQQPDRDIEIQIKPTSKVDGDPGLLRVALQNLIDNAWKYTGKSASPRIEFGEVEGEPGSFYIRDNGAGFDMRFADKMFGVFQRLHHSDEFEGTGIGLATVERILHRHKGTIRAESAAGNTVFTFTLHRAG